MDMNVAHKTIAIEFGEIEVAHEAAGSILLDALQSGLGAPLVFIDNDGLLFHLQLV